MKKQKTVILIDQETYLKSLAKDIGSLGFLLVSCWFNQHFIGGSYFVNFIIFVCFIAFAISGSGVKKFRGVSRGDIKKIIEILEDN